jgi:hypothetical protein
LNVAIDAELPTPVRRIHDLELLLNKLAVARPLPEPTVGGEYVAAKQNVITFEPEGARGVAACVDAQKMASV